ncbi:50S ribosomal protein L11 methyltransferase [Nocardiopsis valliformis]|uniref:50S ribosomal protein L11 methyltransferase n=1 Tax=Nocardiopsis valliformis TaxID=239974 RepID=UPI0003479010|nr:50S ribosomal protein L11 methyltransferase [Nocardiopsis valliformis]
MSKLVDVPFTTDLHLRLLLSLDRGHNVMRAVQAAVNPGDRVLDAGTGSGLLALIALAAGASEAVGIDRQHLDVARAIAAKNGLSDRITFTEADLMDPDIPGIDKNQKFDLLLAFIYTNHPLVDEARSRMVFDLRDRFGTNGCSIVPGQIRYRFAGCHRNDWDMHTEISDLHQAGDLLRGCYGLDFEPLIDRTEQELALKRSRPIDPSSKDWRPPTSMASIQFSRDGLRLLTNPAPFAEIDYSAEKFTGLPEEAELQVTSPGLLTGVVWTQELAYQDRPLWTTETYTPLSQSLHVSAGDRVTVSTDDSWKATNVLQVRSLTKD